MKGITIEVSVSKWDCTKGKLSFHAKAEAKKGIFSCKVIDRNFSGDRHNEEAFEEEISKLFTEMEVVKN